MQRNIQKTLRLNAREKQRLKMHAKKCGVSEEAYLRALLNGVVPKEAPPIDYHRMMRELYIIGNNLNQIAARANSTGFILADEYKQNFSLLMDNVMDIRDVVTMPERLSKNLKSLQSEQHQMNKSIEREDLHL